MFRWLFGGAPAKPPPPGEGGGGGSSTIVARAQGITRHERNIPVIMGLPRNPDSEDFGTALLDRVHCSLANESYILAEVWLMAAQSFSSTPVDVMLVGIPTCGTNILTIESHERIQTSRPIYLHKMRDIDELQLVASEHAATMALPTVLRGREIAHPESLLVRSMRANRRCREFVSMGKLNNEEIASIDHEAADHMRSRLAATIFADIAYVNPLSLRIHYDCRPAVVVVVKGAAATGKKKEPHVPHQVAGLVFAVIRVTYDQTRRRLARKAMVTTFLRRQQHPN